ncbi:MAG: ribonuclease H-like domain-containing protein [Firmicutes bacterium]|nr:ribonuclease H-like domain-containing protein [Candidatus Fermentithermobacillaceae bacterium]HRC53558.1 ribonuclease H-like domain-containing protein [Bacillota bacterium]
MTNKEIVENLRELIRKIEEGEKSCSPDEGDFCHLVSDRATEDSSLSPSRGEVDGMYVPSEIDVETHDGFCVYTSCYEMGCLPWFYPIDQDIARVLLGNQAMVVRDDSDRFLFLDIETTGLVGSGTLSFLTGFGRWRNSRFEVMQYFLSDREKEPTMLEHMADVTNRDSVLVTFNGSSFDIPILTGRFILNGLSPEKSYKSILAHIDLFSLVRKFGKHPVYGLSLKESVARFIGTRRSDDIPGHLIPALYFIYEQDRDIAVLEQVFAHNRMDVIDMVGLLRILGEVCLRGPDVCDDPFTLAGVGKFHLQKGDVDRARRYMQASYYGFDKRGIRSKAGYANMRRLAEVMRKEGNWDDAAHIWEGLIREGQAIPHDYLWLARYHEVYGNDIAKALDIVEDGIMFFEAIQKPIPNPLLSRKRRLERLL